MGVYDMAMKAQSGARTWKEALKEKGYKATPGRIAFLEALARATKPISVEKLRAELDIDLATIYRIVEMAKKAGLIRQIDMRHSHAHYELAHVDDHHHVICLSCNSVIEFEYPGEKKLVAHALSAANFAEITDHTLEFYGYCKKCYKLQAKT